jgi:gliding motility-associated-like protein
MHYKCLRFIAKVFFLTTMFLGANNLFAQKEHNIWYFGGFAGLNFNSGSPVVLVNGKLNSIEACASVADAYGSLLFYTNGITVWNKKHEVMINGNNLGGEESSMETVVAKCPDKEDIYFIFTAKTNGGEFEYSTIDLSKNAGLGEVTNKSQFLLTFATEKIELIKHANGKDIWLIAHEANNNTFVTWLITANGVPTTPTSSTYIGTLHKGSIDSPVGYLRASPNGKTLALAGIDENGGFVETFSFDTSTGFINNVQTLRGFSPKTVPYGIEFSPDNKLLYISEYHTTVFGNLYQVKLPFTNGQVTDKGIVLAFGTNLSALKMGPDNKIYFAQREQRYLHVINNPDVEGTGCNFAANAVFLNQRKVYSGLPGTYITTNNGLNFSTTGKCLGSPTSFNLISGTANFDSITWDFGDPASGADNVSNQRNPSHQFSQPGTYTVKVTTLYNGIINTETKQIDIVASPDGALRDVAADKPILCDEGVVNITAHGATGAGVYNWYDASQNFIVANSGLYQTPVLTASTSFYVAISNGGCEGERVRIDIKYAKATAHITASNTIINPGEAVVLTANDAQLYQWSSPTAFLTATDTKTVTSTPAVNATYKLVVTNADGCTAETTVEIIVRSDIKIPNTFTPNADGINDYWVIKNMDVLDNLTQVFNRNGSLVYSMKNYKNSWNGTRNGKPLPAGTYYYIITLYDRTVLSGNVTILR